MNEELYTRDGELIVRIFAHINKWGMKSTGVMYMLKEEESDD